MAAAGVGVGVGVGLADSVAGVARVVADGPSRAGVVAAGAPQAVSVPAAATAIHSLRIIYSRYRAGHPGYYSVTMSSSTMSTSTVILTGWGRIAPTQAQLTQPDTVAGATRLLAEPARGMIPRGLGRSYNNAAQSAGGMVVSTTRLNRILALDPATGVVTCEAGVSLEQLMVAGLPHGWFVPVSPGTRQVTVGGAIAADVHGKNHHVAG
ncbi:MAG TPA: FAD-binding protein, partial [Streptosporangiaceae bacterium]